jgi:chromosome partitioning protein
MHILSVINNKGGVGKTTAVQNIGAAIATFTNRNVLLVDLDPQGSLTKSFGIELGENQLTSASFILGKSDIEQTAVNYKESNIDILPTSNSLIQDQEKIKKDSQFPYTLIRALEKDQKKVKSKKYDFVIIDCPPAISALTDIALVASDRYYVPLQPEYFSYEGLREFISYANQIVSFNPKLKLGGVFASRFNPHTKKKFSKEIIQRVEEQLEDKFLKTYIRENIALSEAQAQGKHIFDYDRKARGAEDYYKLAEEILTR